MVASAISKRGCNCGLHVDLWQEALLPGRRSGGAGELGRDRLHGNVRALGVHHDGPVDDCGDDEAIQG